MAIAERLKEARVKAGLSQEQVSDRLHVSRQLVSKWESGASEPKASELVQCAAIYGTTLDWLCDCAVSAPAPDTPKQPDVVLPQAEVQPSDEAQPQEETQPDAVRPQEETLPQPEKPGEKPQKRQPSRKAFRVLLLLLAVALAAVIALAALLRDSNQRLREQANHLSINDPFYDHTLPIWNQNNAPMITVDPEAIQTPQADKKTDTYETRRFEIEIQPGKVYQITDFLDLPAGSMVTFQAEYIPSIEFVSYGIMNRDCEATETITHNGIYGRVQVPEAGEYCLYIQNRSEETIQVQGYYTYLVVDAHTPVLDR